MVRFVKHDHFKTVFTDGSDRIHKLSLSPGPAFSHVTFHVFAVAIQERLGYAYKT